MSTSMFSATGSVFGEAENHPLMLEAKTVLYAL